MDSVKSKPRVPPRLADAKLLMLVPEGKVILILSFWLINYMVVKSNLMVYC